MPTNKDLKATRKLKRRATKTNNRRRNIGKQPLSFKHFYKTSHKRNRKQFESKHNNTNKPSPNKKRKLNNAKRTKPQRAQPFGFGKNMKDTETEYQRFLTDINDSDSDIPSDNDTNLTPEIETKQRSASDLITENETIKTKIAQHQTALESLRNADPEFYKHLQETEGNLLSFGESNQFDLGNLGNINDTVTAIQKDKIHKSVTEFGDTANEESEGSEDITEDISAFMAEQEKEMESDNENVQFSDGGNSESEGSDIIGDIVDEVMFEFDIKELQELIADFEQNKSVNAMKRILNGFCSFVELTIEDDKSNKKSSKKSISVANNKAFQKLLHYILSDLGPKLKETLNISANAKKNRKSIPHKAVLKRYLKYLYIFFENISDSAMLRLYLIHCKHLIEVIVSVADSMKRLYLKQISKLWSSTAPNVRIDAFIFLYEIGKRMHARDLQNYLFKFMYGAFVKVSKRVSLQTMPGINFMINCMKEIYLLNPVLAYKDAFKRLRAIAFHVKQSITIIAKHHSKNASTKELRAAKLKQYKLETIQSIYNWRFVNIIRLWSAILASHSNARNSDIYMLYYPFVQICISVLTLTRSAMYNPARIKIIQALVDLIKECSKSTIMDRRVLYVPLAPYLISILNNPAFAKKKAKKRKMSEENGSDGFDLLHRIKISDKDFGTPHLHNALLSDGIRLMIEYFCNYSYCISFPEIVFPSQVFLKEFCANPNVSQAFKAKMKILAHKLKENANWIVNKRKNVTFSPKDFEKVYAFCANERLNDLSPLSKFGKSKQFSQMLLLAKNAKSEIKKSEESEKSANLKNEKNKQMRKEKKQKKRKHKQEKQARKEKDLQNKSIVNELKSVYEKKNTHKNGGAVTMTGLGDIVQDLELSDDD